MRIYLFFILILISFHVSSQERKGAVAFAEAGLGYSNNLEDNNYYLFTDDIFDPDFFNHGITSEVHLGIMLNKKLNVGLASRFTTSLFFMGEEVAIEHLNKKFPGLALTWQTPGIYRLNNIQLGPIISVPIKSWSLDAELLIGISSLRMPRLFAVASEKPYPNSEELYMYIHRPAQTLYFSTLTPSIGIRRHYNDLYWFVRAELALGWTSGTISYEYYPAPSAVNQKLNSYTTVLFNLMPGVGYKIH